MFLKCQMYYFLFLEVLLPVGCLGDSSCCCGFFFFSGPDSWGCTCVSPAGWRGGRWVTRPASPPSGVETTTWAWCSTRSPWTRAASTTPTASGSEVLRQHGDPAAFCCSNLLLFILLEPHRAPSGFSFYCLYNPGLQLTIILIHLILLPEELFFYYIFKKLNSD